MGGATCFVKLLAEAWEVEEALVEVEEDLEKVPLALEDMVRSESLDICDMDRWRASASSEFFLVCEGERLGMLGTGGSACTKAGFRGFPGARK